MERKKREKGRQTERVIDIANHKDTACFLDLSKTAIHRVFACASFSFKQNIAPCVSCKELKTINHRQSGKVGVAKISQ